MAEPQKAIFVDGGNGSPTATQDEVEHSKDLARRYRCEFVDLKNFHIQHELFRKIPWTSCSATTSCRWRTGPTAGW